VSLTLDDVADALKADLIESGLTVDVAFGEWEKFRSSRTPPLVVIGEKPFRFIAEGRAQAPGEAPVFDESGQMVGVARSFMTVAQGAECYVWAAHPDRKHPEAMRLSRRQTAALRNEVAASLFRLLNGSLAMTTGDWVPASEVSIGAALKFNFEVHIPVLDRMSNGIAVNGYDVELCAVVKGTEEVLATDSYPSG